MMVSVYMVDQCNEIMQSCMYSILVIESKRRTELLPTKIGNHVPSRILLCSLSPCRYAHYTTDTMNLARSKFGTRDNVN